MGNFQKSVFIVGAAVLFWTAPVLAQSTSSITTIAPETARQGKLATRTEIIADRGEAAMITPDSISAMQQAIDMYRAVAIQGGWPHLEPAKLEKGVKSESVVLLRQRLAMEGYLQTEDVGIETPEKFDAGVVKAVKAFQANHGLAATGKVDARTLAELNVPADLRLQTLEINLPRVEEYSRDLGERYILVNIPAAQLEAVNSGAVYSRHNIVVGRPELPSPAVASTISEINFNPYWNVPVSIVEHDLIPKLVADPQAMQKMRIRVFDGQKGPEIDPTTVDWSSTPADRFFFRQDPGPENSLGTVKINFPNPYAVYLHDTPAKNGFGRNDRYESHGCIRVERVNALIDWILNGQQGFDESLIEDLQTSGQRTDLQVRNPPDVRLMYLTGWATDDGRVQFRPDIYNLDPTGFIIGQPAPVSGM